MRIRTIIICIGILALGGCETTQTGAASKSSKKTGAASNAYPDQMIQITYNDVTIQGPFRYHAGYLQEFADRVIDNWERVWERHTAFKHLKGYESYTTGRITVRVRLTNTGNITRVYIIDRSGPSDLEMMVRRCLRSTSGIPSWDEAMHRRFGDDDLFVRLIFEYRNIP